MFNIAMVGAGAIAESHKNAILQNDSFSLVAVCDINEDKAKIVASGTNAKIYTDYRVMCESENIDVVILNLPHFLHKEVSVYFLEHRVAVLIEKPMAINVSECDEMINASVKNDIPLVVGHVQKYFGCYKMLREIIASGRLGKLCCITETRNTDYFTGRPSWFLDRKLAGGGIVMNYCAHTLDKIFYVTDVEVAEICAAGNNFLTSDNVEASAQVLLKFTGGETASFTYCGTKIPGQYDTYFYFTNGVAYVEQGGHKLHIRIKGAQPEAYEFNDDDIFGEQIAELEKMLSGENHALITAEQGRKIVDALERIIACIHR